MSCIYRKLHLSPRGENRFMLLREFVYKEVRVPVGFVTNGANIPRIFWSLIPPNKTDNLPAVVIHNYLCEKEQYAKADQYFDEILKKIEVSTLERVTLVSAVKVYHFIRYGEELMRYMIALLALVSAFYLAACSNESTGTSYKIDGNGTIPALDTNQYMIPDKNVTSIVADNGGYVVTCSAGSTCNVQIGDITTISDTNNSDSHNVDSNDIDSHDVDSVTVPPVTVIPPTVITPVVTTQ